MKAYLHQLRISSKKVCIVAALIRGKHVVDALTLLSFTPKRSAPIIAKLVASAAANAEANFKQKKENLVIKSIVVTEGMTLKRGNPVSRGRWHPILKRASHVTVELAAMAHIEKVDAQKNPIVKNKEVQSEVVSA